MRSACFLAAVACAAVAFGCSSDDGLDGYSTGGAPGSGGTPGSGGVVASGGALSPGNGGAAPSTGGQATGTGGLVGTGGTVVASGGTTPGSGGTVPGSGGAGPGSGGAASGGAASGGAASGGAASGGAASGGAGSGGAPPAGGFPKTDAVNTAMPGPYKFATSTEGLSNPTYASSIMYYPTDAPPPYAVIVFSPGFTATKEDYTNYYGAMIASHGMVILLTTPTSTSDQPRARGTDLEAAVAQIAKENAREGSPVKGKLAPDRICVTGHSMGGGGTLWAANTLGNKIRCAVPLQPYQPGQSFASITAPTMIVAAQSDNIATVSSNAWPHYQSIPTTVAKYFVEFAGADHYLSTNRATSTSIAAQAKWMIPFYKAYLEDDPRYLALLNEPKTSDLSRYLKSK